MTSVNWVPQKRTGTGFTYYQDENTGIVSYIACGY